MSRKQEHEIIIDAPLEAVWKAIVDGEELTRWFVDEASVTPGVGGTVEISWDGGEKGRNQIDVWEPNQKLRLSKPGPAAAQGGESAPMVLEYTIERRDGKTVLRLVHSGIPSGPEWDSFYDGTNSGWPSFLRTLRHYLERHPGKPRATIKVIGKLPVSLEEGWARLTGSGGFGFTPVAGQQFSTTTGPGDVVQGTVVFVKQPGMLEITIDELDQAYLAHAMAGAGPNQYVYTVLSVYGKSAEEVEAIRAKWQPWLKSVLGVDAPSVQS
ncbi:MAG TPA: SRPBCC domain-containing protein [Vicinamibacterales bacterium]|nr:SRPBCC domain-containing protein [Vicinamibacterales bacterium]